MCVAQARGPCTSCGGMQQPRSSLRAAGLLPVCRYTAAAAATITPSRRLAPAGAPPPHTHTFFSTSSASLMRTFISLLRSCSALASSLACAAGRVGARASARGERGSAGAAAAADARQRQRQVCGSAIVAAHLAQRRDLLVQLVEVHVEAVQGAAGCTTAGAAGAAAGWLGAAARRRAHSGAAGKRRHQVQCSAPQLQA